jgi:hypothetical protein
VLATAFGGIVYIAAAYLLRVNEFQEVLEYLRGRFQRAASS